MPSRRVRRFWDDCTATRQPTAHVVHVDSTWSRSHGRAVKRYGVAVSAPTGQICTVLPLKYDSKGSVGNVATSTRSPRPAKSICASPATSSAKRVQRAHWMHRSRSSRTRSEMAIGFSKWRFSSTKRLSPGPYARVWSCSGHSPPLSHTGQSSGWFARRNSSTPSCAFFTRSLLLSTTMPSVTSTKQAGVSVAPRGPSTSTRHMRHMPTGSMRGW